jgi:FMN reductase
MAPEPVRVLGIGGSTRPDSSSERALRVAAGAAAAAGATVELLTGRTLVLPLYTPDGRAARHPAAAALLGAVRRADALLVASPGYHGTVSGMVKNALDYLEELRGDDPPYLTGRPVGCIAVADGWQAAVSTLQTLRICVHALRGWPSPLGAALNTGQPQFDPATGACTDPQSRFQLDTVGRQVTDFAAAHSGHRTPSRDPAPSR